MSGFQLVGAAVAVAVRERSIVGIAIVVIAGGVAATRHVDPRARGLEQALQPVGYIEILVLLVEFLFCRERIGCPYIAAAVSWVDHHRLSSEGLLLRPCSRG